LPVYINKNILITNLHQMCSMFGVEILYTLTIYISVKLLKIVGVVKRVHINVP